MRSGVAVLGTFSGEVATARTVAQLVMTGRGSVLSTYCARMPLYEQSDDGLRAFTQVKPGPDLFESEIEALAWSDPEAFTGEALFPVAR